MNLLFYNPVVVIVDKLAEVPSHVTDHTRTPTSFAMIIAVFTSPSCTEAELFTLKEISNRKFPLTV